MLLHPCLAYQERWQPEGLTERFYPGCCYHWMTVIRSLGKVLYDTERNKLTDKLHHIF